MEQNRDRYTLLKPLQQPGTYNESCQSVQLSFSFAKMLQKGQIQPLFRPVVCRDYLSDIIHSEWNGMKCNVLGFSYDPKLLTRDSDRTRMVLSSPSAKVMANLDKNLEEVLHKIEKQNSFSPTRIVDLDGGKNFLIEGDPAWQAHTFLIASYTLIMRLCGNKINNLGSWYADAMTVGLTDYSFHETTNGRWRDMLPRLSMFLQQLPTWDKWKPGLADSPSGYVKETDPSCAHTSGVISWCGTQESRYNKHMVSYVDYILDL